MFSRSESDIVSSSMFHALIVPLNGRYVMLISISQYRFSVYGIWVFCYFVSRVLSGI